MNYQILQGDNRETLKTLADNSIDAIVTDPPYGIDFLGKSWDANTGALETYQECLRVLKPGGHILAFSAARTYHHLAVTLEQAGFEIRDQIMWIYSSGFPKSQNVGKMIDSQILTGSAHTSSQRRMAMGDDYTAAGHYTVFSADKESALAEASRETKTAAAWTPKTDLGKQYQGWGTALKPAHEPIALARKPIKGSIAKNCQIWGTGALNIDAGRVPYDGPNDKPVPHGGKARLAADNEGWHKNNTGWKAIEDPEINPIGRFPSNVLGEIAEPYQKYFYCPKVSRRERHIGHETPPAMFGSVQGAYGPDGNRMAVGLDAREGNTGNNHPTVKPIELMKYLIKLVTPPGGTVLDPFNGSGSTGCAAVELGHPYIGCELDPAYVEISRRRIEAWAAGDNNFDQLFQEQ